MARASPVLGDALRMAGVDGASTGPLTPVPLPALHDMPAELHCSLFLAAVEYTCARGHVCCLHCSRACL